MKIHGICLRHAVCAAVLAALCGMSPIASGQEVTKKDFDELKKDVNELKTEVQRLTAALTNAKVGETAANIDALTRRVDELESKLGSIVGGDGDAVAPSILGNMQKNPTFRQEMGKVIQGKIVVTNTTGYDQFVYINGIRWRAPAGMSYTYVPYGTVQTQL